MVKVKFLMDDLEVDAEEDAKLLDVCRESGSSIPFGCTNGVCGTCISKIVSGKNNLSEPSDKETQTLEMFGASEDHRLVCQCTLKGDVELDNP